MAESTTSESDRSQLEREQFERDREQFERDSEQFERDREQVERDREQFERVRLREQTGWFTRRSNTTFLSSGLVFLVAALVLFVFAGFSLYWLAEKGVDIYILEPKEGPKDLTLRDIYNFYGRILSYFLAPLLLVISAGICSFVGISLLRAAGAVSQQVIPQQDYEVLAPAIAAGNAKAVSEYIRLSSLSGMTGTFTKIGLTGLPLATIFLTVVLAIIGIFNDKFFDLAQLTLGAFIGSYVQKRREEIPGVPEPPASSGAAA